MPTDANGKWYAAKKTPAQEAAAKKAAMLKRYPDYETPVGGRPSTLAPGTIEGTNEELEAWQRLMALRPPQGVMATDPDVLNSYNTMQQYSNQSDVDTSTLRRKLADSLLLSKQNRGKSILGSNQRSSDRGLLNSGITLGRNAELETTYDTTDRSLTDLTNTSLADIARKKLGYEQAYKDSQVASSAKQTKAQADAMAASLEAQRQAAEVKRQQDELMAALNPVAAPAIAAPAPVYKPPTTIYKPPPVTKKASVASKKALPKLVLKGGPQ